MILIYNRKRKKEQTFSHLLRLNIIHWQEVKDKDNVMVDPTKSTTKSSKEHCYGDNGEDKLKQAGECISIIIIVSN